MSFPSSTYFFMLYGNFFRLQGCKAGDSAKISVSLDAMYNTQHNQKSCLSTAAFR